MTVAGIPHHVQRELGMKILFKMYYFQKAIVCALLTDFVELRLLFYVEENE